MSKNNGIEMNRDRLAMLNKNTKDTLKKLGARHLFALVRVILEKVFSPF
jgi:hypothetical protein